MINPFDYVRLNDVIDIGFVAVLLYAVIVWIRRTRASSALVGIFILGAVYIVARQLDLQLTASVFQGFIAIFLIMIVVIFQEELKQIFERIALWSFGRTGGRGLDSGTADVLMRSVVDFQKDRVGALIVVRGKDALDRHISGGIELSGKLSEPLLKSIFDPHSPGHDGAVIVEGDRITRFVAHLPLSRDFEQLADLGTRHSAALGLSELTDALCLVVSEQRGTLSIARDGRLRDVRSPQEMGSLLGGFMLDKYPGSRNQKKFLSHLVRENWIEKATSLILAVALWYIFIPGSATEAVSYQIPLKLENMPQDVVLDRIEPPAITATFSGPRRAFYLFDPNKLKVTLDTSLVKAGRRTFRVSEKDVLYPRDLTLTSLNPSTVRISVKKLADAQADGGAGGLEQ